MENYIDISGLSRYSIEYQSDIGSTQSAFVLSFGVKESDCLEKKVIYCWKNEPGIHYLSDFRTCRYSHSFKQFIIFVNWLLLVIWLNVCYIRQNDEIQTTRIERYKSQSHRRLLSSYSGDYFGSSSVSCCYSDEDDADYEDCSDHDQENACRQGGSGSYWYSSY
jgi:hypothetical protein